MKKSISLIALLLSIAFTFISCSMFDQNAEDDNASVSFEIPAELYRAIAARVGGDNVEQENIKIEINVKLTGTYTSSKSLIKELSSEQMEEVFENDGNSSEIYFDAMNENQTISFNSVPVGSKVKAEMFVLLNRSFGHSQIEQKQAVYKGKSETIKVKRGKNNLPLKVKKAYKENTVTINLDFSNSSVNLDKLDSAYILALTPDSDLLKEFYNRFSNGNGNKDDVDYINSYMNTADCAGYGYWFNNSNDPVQQITISDRKIQLTGNMDLMVDEELVFFALINFTAEESSLAPNGIPFIGYIDMSSIDALNGNAINPAETAVNINLKTRGVSQGVIYALYNVEINTNIQKTIIHYYLNTNLDYVSPFSSFDSDEHSFTYDSMGNIYIYSKESESPYTPYILSANGKTQLHLMGSDDNHFDITPNLITMDRATNIMYVLFADSTGYFVYKLNGLPSEVNTGDYVKYQIGFPTNTANDNDLIVVNNGIIYGFGSNINNSMRKLYKLDLDSREPVFIANTSVSEDDLTNLGIPSNASVTDMLYQDGCIYLLIKESRTGYEYFSSRGAIVKYDIANKQYSKIGFTDGKDMKDGFMSVCKYGSYPVYNTDKVSKYVGNFRPLEGQQYNYKIYAPYENENSYFVGADKFVAIKPKKLVVSDAGIAFYTNSDGLVTKKKVNRVIEIDLDTLSMENAVKQNVDLEFHSEYPTETFSGIKIRVVCESGAYYTKNGDSFNAIIAGEKDFIPYFGDL